MAPLGLAWPMRIACLCSPKTPSLHICTLRLLNFIVNRQGPPSTSAWRSVYAIRVRNPTSSQLLILKHHRHPPAVLVPIPRPPLLSSTQRDNSVTAPVVTAAILHSIYLCWPRPPPLALQISMSIIQSKRRFVGDRDLAVEVIIAPQDAPEVSTHLNIYSCSEYHSLST